eukprot:COSAG04_NODE_30_length_35898_cov_42.288053_6_plen_315_part_00
MSADAVCNGIQHTVQHTAHDSDGATRSATDAGVWPVLLAVFAGIVWLAVFAGFVILIVYAVAANTCPRQDGEEQADAPDHAATDSQPKPHDLEDGRELPGGLRQTICVTTNPLQSSPTAISDDGASGPGVSGGRVSLDAVCAVCLDQFVAGESIAVLPECGHKFHGKCLADWLEESNSCPMCRTVAVPGAEDDDDDDGDAGPTITARGVILGALFTVVVIAGYEAIVIASKHSWDGERLLAHLWFLAIGVAGGMVFIEIWRFFRPYIRTDASETLRQFVASVVAEQREEGVEPTAVSPPVAATEPADDASASAA